MNREIPKLICVISNIDDEVNLLMGRMIGTVPVIDEFANEDWDKYITEREKHYKRYEYRVNEVMEKKAVIMNSLRRNSFAYMWG